MRWEIAMQTNVSQINGWLLATWPSTTLVSGLIVASIINPSTSTLQRSSPLAINLEKWIDVSRRHYFNCINGGG